MRYLTVPKRISSEFCDMTSCEHNLCLYISDNDKERVHKLGLQGAATRWPVDDELCGLSVNKLHNVMVTCPNVRKIKEFSSDCMLLRELTLPDDVISPWHAIQLTSGQFIVCHGHPDVEDAVHRVCKISADGRHIVHSHGGKQGSGADQYNMPINLAVDNNEFVFVLCVFNRGVKLSPTLNYVRQLVTADKLNWVPFNLHFDVQRRRLYVAETYKRRLYMTTTKRMRRMRSRMTQTWVMSPLQDVL